MRKIAPETATYRQKTYLDRLKKMNGRRVVVDLDEELSAMLDELLKAGYGRSQAEVVRRSLREAHEGVPQASGCPGPAEGAITSECTDEE